MYKFHIYEKDVCIGEQWGLSPDDACERYCRRNDFPIEAAQGFNAVAVKSESENRIPYGWACI